MSDAKNSYTYDFKIYFKVAFLLFVLGLCIESKLVLDWSQAAAWASTFFGIFKYGNLIYETIIEKSKSFLNFSDFMKTAITYPILILLLGGQFNHMGYSCLSIFMMVHAFLMVIFTFKYTK